MNTNNTVLTDDQWVDLAERHANSDWNSDQPDGYLNAVKALCQDFLSILPAASEADPWPMLDDLHLRTLIQLYNDGYSKAYDGREFANPCAAYKQLRDALSRQPSAAASMGDVKLSEGDTVYYGDQVSGASLRYHSRDQIIEYANACVLADRQKRAQDGAKLCEHLRFAVTVLEENRQRIGYVPGSPIDVRVREARAALAAAKPEGGK